MHVRLLRRSDLRPTRMRGVVGQKWRTSGYHFAFVSLFLFDVESIAHLVHDIL
jgi:hypothetical protein